MKIKLEKVQPDDGSSFRILKNPRLNELFYWHYHPEYELIFITGSDGTRHIGDHISIFKNSDLVFMGPNIPHLNFDFGIRKEYEKVVIQLQEDFLQEALADIPELSDIRLLFAKARRAIAFNGETKRIVGEKLKEMIQQNHFRQWILLLEIFQLLATSNESEVLNIPPIEHNYNLKDQQRIKKIYRFVEEHYHEKVDVQEVVSLCNLSMPAFCRYFKRMTNMTFTEFLNQYRVNQAKKLLLKNYNVSEACYQSGFTNLSYFNKTFNRYAQENPMHFKKRHVHAHN